MGMSAQGGVWRRLWRTVWWLLAATAGLALALLLLAMALVTLAVLWVRARLTGRPMVWAGWRETAASRVWTQVRRTGGGAMPGADRSGDVVDVEAREVPRTHPPMPERLR